jgi:hypothetical protein
MVDFAQFDVLYLLSLWNVLPWFVVNLLFSCYVSRCNNQMRRWMPGFDLELCPLRCILLYTG